MGIETRPRKMRPDFSIVSVEYGGTWGRHEIYSINQLFVNGTKMSNIRTTSFVVPVCIAVCLSLMVTGLSGCSSLRRDLFFMGWDTYKSTTRIVARKEISRERFQDLIRYNRAPDILSYLGTKDDMDYFVSAHVILRGQKPFHYNRFDLSVYWLPSAQVGFRHHLAYISDFDESVYYDTYASVDALKSQLDQMSSFERSAGHHSISATSLTVDGGYDVVETPQNVRLVFFLTDSDAAGKRGFVHAGTHTNVSDLVRAGLARELEDDARTVLCYTPPTLGLLAIYQTAPCNSRQDFFEGWFEFYSINPVSSLLKKPLSRERGARSGAEFFELTKSSCG